MSLCLFWQFVVFCSPTFNEIYCTNEVGEPMIIFNVIKTEIHVLWKKNYKVVILWFYTSLKTFFANFMCFLYKYLSVFSVIFLGWVQCWYLILSVPLSSIFGDFCYKFYSMFFFTFAFISYTLRLEMIPTVECLFHMLNFFLILTLVDDFKLEITRFHLFNCQLPISLQ